MSRYQYIEIYYKEFIDFTTKYLTYIVLIEKKMMEVQDDNCLVKVVNQHSLEEVK